LFDGIITSEFNFKCISQGYLERARRANPIESRKHLVFGKGIKKAAELIT